MKKLGPNATKQALKKSGYQKLRAEFEGLVQRLLALEASGEATRMRAYIRQVVPLLAFDAHDVQSGVIHEQDAASAALHELAVRLGKSIPWRSSLDS